MEIRSNEREKNFIRLAINYIVFFLCIFNSLFIFNIVDMTGYEYLFLMPLIYSLCFIFVFSKIVIKPFRVFFLVFILVSFARYVILPFLIALTGYYGGRSGIPPQSSSYSYAILLMIYELVVSSFFILLMESRKHESKNKSTLHLCKLELNEIFLDGEKKFYFIFGLIVICLVIINPGTLKSINFLVPSSDATRNFSGESLLKTLTVYSVIILKQLLFCITCDFFYRRYKKYNQYKYVIWAGTAALLNMSIYFGTNRSDVIISGTISFLLLYKLFGKRSRGIIIVVVLMLAIIVSGISTVRGHVSISKNTSALIDITDTLQCYLGGPYNVSIALETKKMFPEASSIKVLFFDIFRPMIGVNLLVKNLPIEYSNIYFNRRIWLGIERRSQILPMIGQGNLFFGWMLSPILTVIFIGISYWLYKSSLKPARIEMYYFLNLSLARLGFMMGQNTMNMINDLSMNLLLFLLIYYLNSRLKTKRASTQSVLGPKIAT